MTGSAEVDVQSLPGNALVAELYRRLFRRDYIGPVAVVLVSIVGALIGMAIWIPAWPLLALAIGGTAAVVWRFFVADRAHAADLVAWRYREISDQWAGVTGLAVPITPEALRGWIASDAFRRANRFDQAHALIAAGETDRARQLLDRVRASDKEEAARLATLRVDLEFTLKGSADLSQWQEAVARLKGPSARGHRASMAIYTAAQQLDSQWAWLRTLDEAARQLGPFEQPLVRKVLRRIYPITPVLIAISIVHVAALLFAPQYTV